MMIFRLFLPFAVCVCLASCGRNQTLKIGDQDVLALGPQDECHFMMNLGMRVSWKSSTPVHLVIHPRVPPEFDAAIASAVQRWNKAFGKNLLEVSRGGAELGGADSSDGINGIYWDTEWVSGEENKQAWTWTKWDLSKIKDSDIRINAKNFRFYVDGDSDIAGRVHFESLLVHEMGHVLGLSHNDDRKLSVMRVTLQSGESRTGVGEPDVESLRCEY